MKGYVKDRQREWRKLGHEIVEQSTGANVEGWEQLRRITEKGAGVVQVGGDRLVTH